MKKEEKKNKKRKWKNQILSTNFHSLLRYILYFSYVFVKTTSQEQKQIKMRKNNNYIGCECSLEVIRIRNRIYPIAEWIQLISPHSFCAVYTVGTVQWVLPFHLFFSVYLSCIHFSSPLIHWCSKNRNIIKTFLGFQSN